MPVSGFFVESSDVPDELDWSVVADCDVDELGFVVVDCWSALAPLVTLCEPLPTFTPGLTFAPAFTLELSTPTFASTPTFGFTLVVVELPEDCEPLLPEAPDWSCDDPLAPPVVLEEPDDWSLEAPCDMDEDGLAVVDCWFASEPLVTLCEPLPTFTPGLTSAPMLALELLTPTFASTPTFGFALNVVDELLLVEPGVEERFVLSLMLVLLEELGGALDCEAPLRFRSMSVELELLVEGAGEEPPFRLMSVELEELLPGVEALPVPP